jgi:hypothetical protein
MKTQQNIAGVRPRPFRRETNTIGTRIEEKKRTLRKAVVPVMEMIAVLVLPPLLWSSYAEAAVNLIPNPSVENQIAAPEGWLQGKFGSNTAKFTYSATEAIDGQRALRIDMASYSSGDAKWYPEDIPVTPGKTYVFSDYSRSDVPTAVDVRYMKDAVKTNMRGMKEEDAFRYDHLGDIPAQSTSTKNQFTFTVPENIKSRSVFDLIEREGYLITDNFSLMESGGTTTPADTIAPIISLTAPLNGATVLGTTTLSATATDTVGVVGVKFVHSGTNHADVLIGAEDTVSPYSIVWNTIGVANGIHQIEAIARDAAGNVATSSVASVTVNNGTTTTDTIAPVVSITAPLAGATVSGTTTAVSVNATDTVAVAGVKLKLDGVQVGTEMTTAPYNFAWDTTAATNGTHLLTAEARDAAGNIGTSTAVSVTVNNATTTVDTTAPIVSITAPASGATIYGTTTISATTTDAVGVAGVKVKIDGTMLGTEMTVAPFSLVWNTVGLSNGAHVITAEARDAAGNIGTSTAVSVTVNNATTTADTTAPIVSITAPANNAAITGTSTVSVAASDAVGVVGVRLALDGVLSGDEATAAPYEFTWNSADIANGSHTIAAQARDTAGNIGTSTPITITVNN